MFFSNFLEIKDEIQEKYYEFCNDYKVQIKFFDWFETFYAHKHKIAYPFKKSKTKSNKTINPVTMINKTPEWKVDDQIVQFEHPPLKNISFLHGNLKISVAPFKLPQDNDDSKNLKHIVL